MHQRTRRLPLYVFFSLALVLAALFLAYFARQQVVQGPQAGKPKGDPFVEAMNVGKNFYEAGNLPKALEAFQRAVELNPVHPDALLNLANAQLRSDQLDQAIQRAQQVLEIDYRSAAAHYVIGCAHLRRGENDAAVRALQTAHDIEPSVAAASFQLARAHLALGNLDEAIFSFQETTIHDAKHAAAYYLLSQALVRADRKDEAALALQTYQQLTGDQAPLGQSPEMFEQCKHTGARAPFVLEQPEPDGARVRFADATSAFLGSDAAALRGPVTILDVAYDDWQDVLARRDGRLALLRNEKGALRPQGDPLPGDASQLLLGDLQNDHVEDVVALGPEGFRVFKFNTNGVALDITAQSGLPGIRASHALLADLDLTGKLDLMAIGADGASLLYLRNQGNSIFADMSLFSGLPKQVAGARQLLLEDWNNDDLPDLIVARADAPPLLLLKQRGGGWSESPVAADWPAGSVIAVGDLNNDLRNDLVVATADGLVCVFNGVQERATLPLQGLNVRCLTLLDYDNDGWLDLFAGGDGLRAWRNRGNAGFADVTAALGLAGTVRGTVAAMHPADFDVDCDSDLLLDLGEGGLQFLRNDGGSAGHQLKLRFIGQRSNGSGLGVRVEVSAGGLRLARTVSRLPVEIGVGAREKVDAIQIRWHDLSVKTSDVKVDCQRSYWVTEMKDAAGSCPYLYAWDGTDFRFVTDLLGAAPLGLPVADGVLIAADPDEFVWVGDETNFQPRHDRYTLQITEELREVLYLDEAKLVVADHPPGTEVHPTSKLRPRGPFPPHSLVTLEPALPLRRAEHHDGSDVTAALQAADRVRVSPLRKRVPQLRGLAEPFGVTLDFGPLPHDQPLVLVLNGWLQFGGGMANLGASHDPTLPFPFPTLEVETGTGRWQPVQVDVGAPAGKTKTILVDLAGQLPPDSHRLRLTTAFEIHWDRIALMRPAATPAQLTVLSADRADLHWRGFSERLDLPPDEPQTPDYRTLLSEPRWRLTPSGWCTRYGDVRELIGRKDNALVLMNGGDALTLEFATSHLPAREAGAGRSFFLFTSGWDKDADHHVRQGWTVEPLPFHGMDDQAYGSQAYPFATNRWWIERYNTRWVGPRTFSRN
jgi:tetratricopeptide (TPR) repeat protein